jgi:hypothetical protein
MLALELQDLQGLGYDLALTGFDAGELKSLMEDSPAAGLTGEDTVPAAPAAAEESAERRRHRSPRRGDIAPPCACPDSSSIIPASYAASQRSKSSLRPELSLHRCPLRISGGWPAEPARAPRRVGRRCRQTFHGPTRACGIRRRPRYRPPRRQRPAPAKRTKADRHRLCRRKSLGRCCAPD